jgi:hypothetical protein
VNKTQFLFIACASVILRQSFAAESSTTSLEDPITAEYEAVRSGRESLEQFRTNITHLRENRVDSNKDKKSTSVTPNAEAQVVPPQKESTFKTLEDYFSIRKSFLSADDETEPANFSWTRAVGAPSFYSIDVAILLKGHSNNNESVGFSFLGGRTDLGDYKLRWKIEPTFEAHISTNNTNAQDSMSARLPVTLSWEPHSLDAQISEWFLTASPVYEFDRLNNNQTIGGDAFLTANVFSVGIGQFLWLTGRPTPRFQPDNGVVFHWRPFVGFEAGHVIDAEAGTVLSEQSEFARFATKLHAELAWVHKRAESEKNELPYTNRFIVAANYYFRHDFIGGSTHNYFDVSPTWYLDDEEHFSVGLTYKRGETTPKFAKVDELTLWLGTKF